MKPFSLIIYLLLNQHFPTLFGMEKKISFLHLTMLKQRTLSLCHRGSLLCPLRKFLNCVYVKYGKTHFSTWLLVVILDMFATYLEVIRVGDVSFSRIFSQIQMFWYYISENLSDCKYTACGGFRLINLFRDCSSAILLASFGHLVHRFVKCLNDVVFLNAVLWNNFLNVFSFHCLGLCVLVSKQNKTKKCFLNI